MNSAQVAPTRIGRPRSNRFTEDQDRVIDGYLSMKNRTYSWLLDTAIRRLLAEDGIDYPEKYGVRRAA